MLQCQLHLKSKGNSLDSTYGYFFRLLKIYWCQRSFFIPEKVQKPKNFFKGNWEKSKILFCINQLSTWVRSFLKIKFSSKRDTHWGLPGHFLMIYQTIFHFLIKISQNLKILMIFQPASKKFSLVKIRSFSVKNSSYKLFTPNCNPKEISQFFF